MRKGLRRLAVGLAVLLVPPSASLAQDHGGGGGGGGCGDVFGDLIHVLRRDATGQPILQKRCVELPKEVPGYGWGYCKVAVAVAKDELGNTRLNPDGTVMLEELDFLPLSCDVAEPDRVIAVDYFGRLNGGRTKERNNRMHFNEVLSSIKEADRVRQDPSGRLELGYCQEDATGSVGCEWSTVDSPMESLGLYSRLMRYGHFQTDPFEVDPWRVGDPKLPAQYHPALGPEDYAKFHTSVRHLLWGDGADPWDCFDDVNGNETWDPTEPYTDLDPEEGFTNGQYDLGEPFTDINGNGVRDSGGDTFSCTDVGTDPANPRRDVVRESLDERDFTRGAVFLGAAANKTGRSTRDLVQYVNRILKIAQQTPHTYATLHTLPPLVRVCPTDPEGVDCAGGVEPEYTDDCNIVAADPTDPVAFPNAAYFPDMKERFVDFLGAEYERLDWRHETVEVIRPSGDRSWEEGTVYLPDWLAHENGPGEPHENIDAFVEATADTIRAIQFIHNYAIPEELWTFGDED